MATNCHFGPIFSGFRLPVAPSRPLALTLSRFIEQLGRRLYNYDNYMFSIRVLNYVYELSALNKLAVALHLIVGPNFVAMKVCRINFHRHTVFVTFVVVR